MRSLFPILSVVLLLVSCSGDDPAGPGRTVEGTWRGTFRDQGYVTQELTLYLSESQGTVSGSATLTEATFSGWTVSGTFEDPTMFVTIRLGGSSFTLTASVSNTLLIGALGGLQAPSVPITLARVAAGGGP